MLEQAPFDHAARGLVPTARPSASAQTAKTAGHVWGGHRGVNNQHLPDKANWSGRSRTQTWRRRPRMECRCSSPPSRFRSNRGIRPSRRTFRKASTAHKATGRSPGCRADCAAGARQGIPARLLSAPGNNHTSSSSGSCTHPPRRRRQYRSPSCSPNCPDHSSCRKAAGRQPCRRHSSRWWCPQRSRRKPHRRRN
jgi:hypothetical protein